MKEIKTETFPKKSPLASVCILLLFVAAVCFCSGCMSARDAPDVPVTSTPPAVSPTGTATGIPSPAAAVPATQNISDQPLQRIIVTNADAAELLLAIGAGDQVVGISDTVKDHPVLGPHYAGKTSIGSWQTPDVETIISLHPDAVISYSSYLPKNADKITSTGIPLLLIDCYKFDSLASDTLRLANLTGKQDEAAIYLKFLDQYTELVKTRLASAASADQPRVYFESYSDYSALTGGSGGDILVTMAGGSNIAGLLPVSSPKVNAEWVLAENPDVIIKVAASGKNVTELQEIRRSISERTVIANTSAVKTGQVYVISNSLTYGPRSVIGLVYLAKILHPQEFEDIRPSAILDEYSGRFVAGANISPVFYGPG